MNGKLFIVLFAVLTFVLANVYIFRLYKQSDNFLTYITSKMPFSLNDMFFFS